MQSHSINSVPPWTILRWEYITFPGALPGTYMVSSTGLVYSTITNRLLSLVYRNGYTRVWLKTVDGGAKQFIVHRLVAYQFCNPPDNFAELQVNHINAVKDDNRNVNLEWVTSQDNVLHATENGLMPKGEDIGCATLTNDQVRSICDYLVKGYNAKEIAEFLNIEPTVLFKNTVSRIRNRRCYTSISDEYPEFPKAEPHKAHRMFSDEQATKVCEMLSEGGYTYKEMLENIGYNGPYTNGRDTIMKIKRGGYPDISSNYNFEGSTTRDGTPND